MKATKVNCQCDGCYLYDDPIKGRYNGNEKDLMGAELLIEGYYQDGYIKCYLARFVSGRMEKRFIGENAIKGDFEGIKEWAVRLDDNQ